ncbi:N-acetyltransferase [Chitinophaga lutea]|uniref:N-acetyltransferase n=2 Tax=Chitinophaga lutea TaxID=2488634 RepID=A0A3N4Q9I2_9BACT|nr:N-acetyltransferase [Chitinophaga lutea]
MMETITIRPVSAGDIPQAAHVVTKAMLHNPLHLAVFGSADERVERMQVAMFTRVLKLEECNLFAAWAGNEMAGVMNYYEPGCCQISPLKTLGMLPGLLGVLGTRLPRVLKWKANWGRHDPALRHYHFGPLAVLPAMQGRGIGAALLTHFCKVADGQQTPAYLETDKKENVRLYERFGFRVVEEDTLFNVQNWFMVRTVNHKTQ